MPWWQAFLDGELHAHELDVGALFEVGDGKGFESLEDRVDFFAGHASGINNAVGDLTLGTNSRGTRNTLHAGSGSLLWSGLLGGLASSGFLGSLFGCLLRCLLSGSHRGESFLGRSREGDG